MGGARGIVFWCGLTLAVIIPIAIAAVSPQLAWRGPVYIIAGFAGVIAMAMLLLQPLLAGGYLPGISIRRGRWAHRILGLGLISAIVVHVAGLWMTSPPDVIDALLFVSPTPFSDWGVIAMWAVFAAGLLAAARRGLHPRTWRIGHTALITIAVAASVAHALLIEGTMGPISKAVLCALTVLATAKAVIDQRVWTLFKRPKR